jgi:hypothetical protein
VLAAADITRLIGSHDALVPVVALLERATSQQIGALAHLREQVLTEEQEGRDH